MQLNSSSTRPFFPEELAPAKDVTMTVILQDRGYLFLSLLARQKEEPMLFDIDFAGNHSQAIPRA